MMILQMMDVEDVTAIAPMVRSLANDARRLIRSDVPDRTDVEDLLRRIDDARLEYGARPASQMDRWLDNLRRQVEQL